jgi:hypothetical protein
MNTVALSGTVLMVTFLVVLQPVINNALTARSENIFN